MEHRVAAVGSGVAELGTGPGGGCSELPNTAACGIAESELAVEARNAGVDDRVARTPVLRKPCKIRRTLGSPPDPLLHTGGGRAPAQRTSGPSRHASAAGRREGLSGDRSHSEQAH